MLYGSGSRPSLPPSHESQLRPPSVHRAPPSTRRRSRRYLARSARMGLTMIAAARLSGSTRARAEHRLTTSSATETALPGPLVAVVGPHHLEPSHVGPVQRERSEQVHIGMLDGHELHERAVDQPQPL